MILLLLKCVFFEALRGEVSEVNMFCSPGIFHGIGKSLFVAKIEYRHFNGSFLYARARIENTSI